MHSFATPAAARALLGGAVDYAGLFPPSGLEMAEAVANYAAYRAGEDAWALGRFVVPVARLGEFAAAAAPHLPDDADGAPWRLSALLGAEPAADAALIARFNDHHRGRALVDAAEARVTNAEEVWRVVTALPAGFDTYLEIPLAPDPRPLVKAIRGAGAAAKVRAGGLTAEVFPASLALLRFLSACAEVDVPFKATAGLHHPLRGSYPLTYEPGSECGMMYGYLNVLLAAGLLRARAGEQDALLALEETDPAAIRLDGDDLFWRDRHFGAEALWELRKRGMVSFGSCSFLEPVDELRPLFAP